MSLSNLLFCIICQGCEKEHIGEEHIISLDHEIQKGYILGVSSPHKLENFHWYHELGALLGFTKQVFASLRNGHFCAPSIITQRFSR